MRIAVTGGSGKLGRHVVERLRGSGHDVVVLDSHGERAPGFVRVDLTDYGQVADVLGGVHGEQPPVEAVVHLAAIPAPGLAPDAVTFANNVPATFNVLHAAIRQGIRTHRHGVERDGARPALRHPAAVRPGRRGVRRPARVGVLPRQAPRGGDGGRAVPLAPRPHDLGAALLQRHGRRGLRRVPLLRRRPRAAPLEPLGLHRRARRRPGGREGARADRARASTASSSPRPTR